MIIPLPNTNTSKILHALQEAREESGAVALGRVLTLVITTTDDKSEKVIKWLDQPEEEGLPAMVL